MYARPRRAYQPQGEVVEVPIPANFNPGAIIGKAGANCKELGRRFGGFVKVDADRMIVQCIGGDCHGAADAVRRQIASNPHTGAYPHPQSVLHALPAAKAYQFKPLNRPHIPPVTARGVELPSFLLAPASSAAAGSAVDSLTSMLAAQSISPKTAPNMKLLVQPAATSHAYDHICDAASQARSVRPVLDEIKLRYVIGKQSYYESRTPGSRSALQRTYTAEQLRGISLGGDGHFNSRFCREVEEETATRVEDVAADLGFRLYEEKRHISIHLHDYGTTDGGLKGVVVSLKVKDGVCSVRKVKSSTFKPLFVSFINADPDKPDFRLQMVALYHARAASQEGRQAWEEGEGEDAEEAWRFAEGCRWSKSSQEVVLPASERYRVETIRNKIKRVFTGTYDGHKLRFTSSLVESDGGWHHALGGCAPEIQAALKCPHSGAAGNTLVPSGALQAMVRLCEELVSA